MCCDGCVHFASRVGDPFNTEFASHAQFWQVIEDDVNEALRLMKMSKVRFCMPSCSSPLALIPKSLMVSQVSLEDTMQDANPKLDPVTAVYMVGMTASFSCG